MPTITHDGPGTYSDSLPCGTSPNVTIKINGKGGSGGDATTAEHGGGGGGAGYVEHRLTNYVPNTTIASVIDGTSARVTTYSLVAGPGGDGVAATTPTPATGGAAGSASGGNYLNTPGNPGQTAPLGQGGNGGDSPNGGTGGTPNPSPQPANPGTAPGGGGGGGAPSSAGGAGGAARIQIIYTIDTPVLTLTAVASNSAVALAGTLTSVTASSFDLYRGSSSGTETLYASNVGSGSSFTYNDTSVSNCSGSPYFYYAIANEAAGCTTQSNEVSATPSAITVTPVVSSGTVSYFSGGNKAIGRYKIGYVQGAYKYNPGRLWTVNNNSGITSLPHTGGFYVTDGAGNSVDAPGNAYEYNTQVECEVGNSGLWVYFDHVGGLPIGCYLLDSPYADNIAGSPNPTFSLCGPLNATLTASVATLNVGDSTTLTWANVGAVSGSDPIGGSSIGGTSSVSPTTTTTYSFSATGLGITKTVTVTVTVNQPAVPVNLTGVGACDGSIAISWSASLYTASYVLQRSANGSTGWTQIYAGATASFTETDPTPGTTFYYRVASVSGSVTSAWSSVLAASSLIAPPTAGTLTVVAHGNKNVLTWTRPTGNYGTVTTTIYRSLVTGGETSYVTGQTGSTYTDDGLQNDQPYYYKIAFVGDCGTGGQSAEATGTPQCCENDHQAGSDPSSAHSAATAPTSTHSVTTVTASSTAGTAPTSTHSAGSSPSSQHAVGDCPG